MLAQIPLRWLMEKASSHGLTFRTDVVPDPLTWQATISNSHREFMLGAYRFVSRPFQRVIGAPPQASENGHDETVNETIDASVFERWQKDEAYRPRNLAAWAERQKVDLATLSGSVLAHPPNTVVP